jgi:thiamine-monophosphate kinase
MAYWMQWPRAFDSKMAAARIASGETAFIDSLRAIANHSGARGLMDDAAVLELGDEMLVLTHDMMVEGVHTLPLQDPADIAWKLVATNLSDLAAKGAEPLGVLVGYMLGDGDARFVEGLEEVLVHYNVPLLGGDTVSGGADKSRPVARSFGLTAIGRASHIPVPSRSGAQIGDALYLSGPVGAAMMGFEALRDLTGADSSAYRRPMARLAEGQLLAPHVSAMMDVSDGLLLDAFRMAEASAVTFAIDSAAVPLDAPDNRRADALRWGDDYQLLFTAPAAAAIPISAHRIGAVHAQESAPLIVDGHAFVLADGLGYQHG